MMTRLQRLTATGESGACGQEKSSGCSQSDKSGAGTSKMCKDHQRLIMGCGVSMMIGNIVHLPFI
jgi:hypothetical protein